MTGSVDIVIAVAVAADGADVVRVAVLLTGRGNDRGLIAVAGGRDKVRLELIAAGGAGVAGGTMLIQAVAGGLGVLGAGIATNAADGAKAKKQNKELRDALR